MTTLRHWGLLGGLGFFAIFLLLPAPQGLTSEGWRVLAVAVWMVSWWLTEAVPIAVTALIPLVAFPFLGLGTVQDVGLGYTNEAVFLTLGGFLLGAGLERWNLHLRLALSLIDKVGSEPHRVIGGFMLACGFISMWITNAAAALIMLPIALSVAHLLMEERGGSDEQKKHFGTALMLGLAFSASIGGMMTLVGTTTNAVFKGFMEESFALPISFTDWLMIGVPVGVLMLLAAWVLLSYVLFPLDRRHHAGVREVIRAKRKELGKVTHAEQLVLLIFTLTVALWLGKDVLHDAFPLFQINDASIAMLGAILMFVVPADWKSGQMLLEWQDTKEMPWGVLLLLGGGLAMAGMLNDHGVADWLGGKLRGLGDVPPLMLVLVTVALVIFITEFMSNVAVITAFLPVIASVAISFGQNPLLLAIPATFAASCAFMLPIATPPNAIVFSTHLVSVPQMVRAGMWLNLAALVILTLVAYLLLPLVFGVELGVLPDWAQI